MGLRQRTYPDPRHPEARSRSSPTVVADAKRSVTLDWIASESADLRPGVEEPGPSCDDQRDRRPALVDVFQRQRRTQGIERFRRLRVEDGLGQSGGKCYGSISHAFDAATKTRCRTPPVIVPTH